MKRWSQARALLLITAYLLVPHVPASAADPPPSAERPSILLLLTDDQRADTIHALGNEAILTPNLDRLARRGLAFDNAYIMGGDCGAVCRPSRNMLLSGRSFFRFGRHALPDRQRAANYATPEKPSVPAAMKAAGYETYHHGKKGNTARLLHPLFDHTAYVTHHRVLKNGQPGMVVVDDAIAFLKGRKADRPFFMYLAFSEPHDPRIPGEEYLARYEREKIPLPGNYMPMHPFDNGEMVIRDERLEAWPRTEEAIRRHLHEYYATITGLDHHIGRLIQALQELGQLENTIIVFSSDNGLAIGSHGLMGKQSVYEHSVKVPLVIAGPGIPRGRTSALVYLLDLFPTFCELAGAEIPAGLDGESLLPLVRGESPGPRGSAFFAYRHFQRAVRDERWKLIRYPLIDRIQLFDLSADPNETRDLASGPANAERIASMMRLMEEWQERAGDRAPLSVESPADGKWTPPSKSGGRRKL